jgi:hypothetical protein
MSYDHWKTTNPDDQYLGSTPQPGQDDEPDAERFDEAAYEAAQLEREREYWEHFGRYDEEPCEWQMEESSAPYQDRERNR